MGIKLKTTYSDLRVLTGNDDSVLGTVVMPDARCETLLKTAAKVLSKYGSGMPAMSTQTDADNDTELIFTGNASATISAELLQVVIAIAAHRYFVGIADKLRMADSLCDVNTAIEAYQGSTVYRLTEVNLPKLVTKQQQDMASENF